MRRALSALAVLVGLASLPAPAAAGGWVQKEGGFYGKLTSRLLIGSAAYGAGGESVSVPSYLDSQLNLYLEVGVHERVTVVGLLTPYGRARVDGEDSAHYLGPFVAGARVGLLTEGPTRVAVEAHYGYAPSAIGTDRLLDADFTADDGTDLQVVYRPAVETHRVELQGQVGRGFAIRDTPAWVTGMLGVRLNTGFEHALTGYGQVGVQPWRFRFDFHVSLYEPFFQTVELTNVSGVGNTRYLGAGFGIAFALSDNVGLTLDADGVFYAQSNARTPSFAFGIEGRL
ncbi:MAG: hypothetical protein JJ863_31165 [Deltaproteobacteria bacterium]|nr:hypothetical protein [Deltaproteobacteria bacterium]